MARVDIDDLKVIPDLAVSRSEVFSAVIKRLGDAWNYSAETEAQFVERVSSLVAKEVAETRRRCLAYGGDIRSNFEFCQKELAAGRQVDASKLVFRSN